MAIPKVILWEEEYVKYGLRNFIRSLNSSISSRRQYESFANRTPISEYHSTVSKQHTSFCSQYCEPNLPVMHRYVPYQCCLLSLIVTSLPVLTLATNSFIPDQTPFNPSLSKNCTVSYLHSNSTITGDVIIAPYSPLSNNEFPKIPILNTSAWELWFFDAVSPSGDVAISLSFFRDGSQSLLGKGSLRTQFQALWPDGSTYVTEIHAESSVMESCPEESITAFWRGKDEREGSVSFSIAQDLKEAIVTFDLVEVQGTVSMSSRAPAFDGGSDTDGFAASSKLMAPIVYWLQPIPIADVQVALFIKGQELTFPGSGGHDRFWTPYSWTMLMDESYYIRAVAGPYTLIVLRIISRVDIGRIYMSAYLFERGGSAFSSQNGRVSLDKDFVSFELSYHGAVRGSFRDINTGYIINLVSPAKGRHWRFELEHGRLSWDFPTGPVTGNTGFVDTVVGGEVGGKRYQGVGSTGQCQLKLSTK